MSQVIRWAVLGPGKIAHKFADAFNRVPDARLVAVASRDKTRAGAFAAEFSVPRVYDDYQALVTDPEVDIVYVATPHPFHHSQTLLCLEHRKAVLCEKPLTMSYTNAHEMVAKARSTNTFLMEGMWSRFFPATLKVLELIQSGTIGEVRFLRADFGFKAPYLPEGRVFNLQLGGGAQLDVGVYPMFLALLILGEPAKIQASARIATTGADETTGVQLTFRNGSIAHILSSVVADTPKHAEIVGTDGTITMHTPWHKSQSITVKRNATAAEHFDFPFEGIGFEFQLAHVTECMQSGLKQSDLLPLDFSLLMARTADEILGQCGVVYHSLG